MMFYNERSGTTLCFAPGFVPLSLLENKCHGQLLRCVDIRLFNPMRRTQYLNLIAVICVNLFSLLNLARGHTWTALTNAPNRQWHAVASSADGSKLVAVVYGGGIYTSTNSGATWLSNSVPSENWYSVASSADGTRLAAVTFGSGAQIWNSTNSGATWNLTGAPSGSLQNYISIASSADGTKLVAAGASLPTRYIYTSTDSGATWITTSAPNLSWYSVAASSDATKLVAVAWNNNIIYTSTDFGTNWSPHAVPSNYWYSVSSSADGDKLVAVVNGGWSFYLYEFRDGLGLQRCAQPDVVFRGVII